MVGLCFVIPLRKQMIDFNRLAYPGGIATAAILKSPGAGMKQGAWLMLGAQRRSPALIYFWVLQFSDGMPRSTSTTRSSTWARCSGCPPT